MEDSAPEDSWLRFREDLQNLWKAAGSPSSRVLAEEMLQSGLQPTLSSSTIHSYLSTHNNRRVGSDTGSLERLVDALLQRAAESEPTEAVPWQDTAAWQRRWEALRDRPYAREKSEQTSSAHVSLLGWDGVADNTILADQGTETPWLGHRRLARLADMVEGCGQVGMPEAAWQLAKELEHSADRLLPAGSVGVLASRHIAAYWAGEAGQPPVARAKTEEILRACIAVVGPSHALTHLAELRLAHWTARCGDRQEALRLYREISNRQANGRTALLARLARARLDMDAAESATRMRSLLPDLEREFGERHPVALTARHSVVRADLNAGHIVEAQRALPELRDTFVEAFGDEHALTLRLRTTEAGCAHTAGRDEARSMAATAHDDAIRVLGPDHPHTLHAGNVHAITLAIAEPQTAQELWTSLLQAATQSLGDADPLVLTLHHNLAITTQHLGDPAMARSVFERILQEQSDVLGAEAPDTLRTGLNLALAILETDGIETSLPTFHRIHHVQKRVLGPAHPETATSRALIAVGEYVVDGSLAGRTRLADELRNLEELLGAGHSVTRQVQQVLDGPNVKSGRRGDDWNSGQLRRQLSAYSGAGGRGEEEEE
ncbi:tetratricopeptide repeat protein [Streptomyces sp. Qhu-G9]|uniref:tetratricopeptide repeat protein n=1 Tax=Streptomyces sp. Qhu-G9 TaxID=3452799 RepID=UPI0022AC468E|nr:tetratricopeptide repeat protein [Streptomyces aurantiacus]WAU82608.1 tetratricopeptide repeat protein [Streptomyces aurantiacus]